MRSCITAAANSGKYIIKALNPLPADQALCIGFEGYNFKKVLA
jgi:hypothetical protein